MTLSDSDVMRDASTGDGGAFHEVVVRYGTRIVCFLDRFLGDRARANDLAQETFLRLHQRIAAKTISQTGDPVSLLFTIAANLGRDELRRRKTRREGPLGGAADDQAGAESGPEAGMERDERQHAVRAALASLEPDTRMILVLRDVQGFSYEEIASAFGLPLGTVKSRLNRARLAFRDAWVSAGGEDTV